MLKNAQILIQSNIIQNNSYKFLSVLDQINMLEENSMRFDKRVAPNKGVLEGKIPTN